MCCVTDRSDNREGDCVIADCPSGDSHVRCVTDRSDNREGDCVIADCPSGDSHVRCVTKV